MNFASENPLTSRSDLKNSSHVLLESEYGDVARVIPGNASASALIVCEHASNRIPAALDGLGVGADVLRSHVAWDPGALGVAAGLAELSGSTLVHGTISRLVYDLNRPPEAESAIPAQSEVYRIPGNAGLSDPARDARIDNVFSPFHAGLDLEIARQRPKLRLMVTVHSFTPVYKGVGRSVEIGLIHGRDDRFATMMMDRVPRDGAYDIRLNEPYSAADGVAYMLDRHGPPNDLLSVMIEIRNDLIEDTASQQAMAAWLAPWIDEALTEHKATSA